MAGSYLNASNSFGHAVENAGDASETIEEMMWLIRSQIGHNKALNLLIDYFYPMSRGEMEPDEAFVETQKLMNSYIKEERIIDGY